MLFCGGLLITGRIRTRTGHGSSLMIALYRRQARTAEELKLGWLKPLHEVVPELATLGTPAAKSALNGTGTTTT